MVAKPRAPRLHSPARLLLFLIVSLLAGCTARPTSVAAPPAVPAPAVAGPAATAEKSSAGAPEQTTQTVPAPPAATQQAPTQTPLPPSHEEFVARVVAALAALDAPEGWTFTTKTTRRVEQHYVMSGQPDLIAALDTKLTGDGSRYGAGDQAAARYHRTAEFNVVQSNLPEPVAYTLDGEMRLAGREFYVTAAYRSRQGPLGELPGGWTRAHAASTSLVWPDLANLELGEPDQRLGRDGAAQLTGWAARQLESTFTLGTVSAEREKGNLPGIAAAGEIITLKLRPAALLVSLNDVNFSDPASYAVFEAIGGTPVVYRFQIDAAGRLAGWDRTIDAAWKEVDVSNKGNLPANSRSTGLYHEEFSARLALREAGAAAITAPPAAELLNVPAYAPSGRPAPPFATLAEFESALRDATTGGNADAFWARLASAQQMPLIFGRDLAVFGYRGPETQVAWTGDWRAFLSVPVLRVGGSDVWVGAGHFPAGARLEYLVWADGKDMLDPLNPLKETGGLGSKSVFAMPDYTYPVAAETRSGVPQGALTENITLGSRSLGYPVNYRVYTPAGYDGNARLSTIYVTDGQDYLQFGRMTTILDNLISGAAIRPIIAVFIDPRDTATGRNQRDEQFFDNPKYGAFIVEELVPAVEKAYAADPSPDARAILGASNGGYHSAYFALNHADAFHLIGIQSPNFDRGRSLIDAYAKAERRPVKIFMNVGSLEWLAVSTRQMRDAMQAKGYDLRYVETSEVHSYANWRAQLPAMLAYFFPK